MTTLLPASEPWDTPADTLPDWFDDPRRPATPDEHIPSLLDPALLGVPAESASTDEFIASSRSARLRLLGLCARLRHSREEPLWPATG